MSAQEYDLKMDTYMEIFDIRTGDVRKTGIGAMFETEEDTIAAFESARRLDDRSGQFLLDLYVKEDLIDTIGLTEQAVTQISGETVQSAEVYTQYDIDYWERIVKSVGNAS